MVGFIPNTVGPARILTAVFTSEPAADIVIELEMDVYQFTATMREMRRFYDREEFKAVNVELTSHLNQAVKEELYMLEE